MGTAEKGDHPLVLEELTHYQHFHSNLIKADKALGKSAKSHKAMAEHLGDGTFAESSQEVKAYLWDKKIALLMETLHDLAKASAEQLDTLASKLSANADQLHTSHEEARKEHKVRLAKPNQSKSIKSIQVKPIKSNQIQSNPIKSNPIQSNPIHTVPLPYLTCLACFGFVLNRKCIVGTRRVG